MNKIIAIFSLVFISACISKRSDEKSIALKNYSGTALALFQRPISGSTYEVLFFPVCSDFRLLKNEDDFFRLCLKKGVSVVVPSDNENFAYLKRAASRFNLQKNDLNPVFQSVYAAIVELDLKSSNTLSKGNDSNEKSAKQEMVFESGKTLSLSYYIINDIKIVSLKVLY